MKKKLNVMFFMIILLLFCGCFQKDKEEQNIKITNVGWVYENIGEGFGEVKKGCYANFWISYEGEIEREDIDYVEICCINNSDFDGNYWRVSLSEEYFNKEAKRIGGWIRRYNGDNISVMPVGKFEIIIKLKNEDIITKEINITLPGKTTTDGKSYIYNQEDCFINFEEYEKNLNRAEITQKNINYFDENIKIEYNVNDTRVYNGEVIFYDADNNYVAKTSRFKNLSDNTLNVSSFYISGKNNCIEFSKDDIEFVTGKTFNSIEKCHIILYDGWQYGEYKKDNMFDYRSISDEAVF